MQKTSIPFEFIPDLESCTQWLDNNIKEHTVVLFETTISGFILLNLTPRDNVILISYYSTDFDIALQEGLLYDCNFTYFVGWTKFGVPSSNLNVSFVKIYSSGGFSVYVSPREFKPPFLTADTSLLRFKNGTYVEVPNSSKLSPSTFTIEFWAKPMSFQMWGRWMGKSLFMFFGKKEGWEIMWGDNVDNPSIFMAMWNENGTEKRSQFIETPLNQWVYVTIIFNGTHIISYKNGNLNGIVEVGDWRPVFNSEPFRIGRAFDNSYYDGFFASLRFYNRTLSSAEIAHNIFGDITHNSLLEFDFVDRGSATMPDLSGEGNNGIIINYEDN
jgi:hypothetical protein